LIFDLQSFIMLFNKSIFAIAIVALANVVIAVQTPACVLKVIGYVRRNGRNAQWSPDADDI
jgi:hypothetical protein